MRLAFILLAAALVGSVSGNNATPREWALKLDHVLVAPPNSPLSLVLGLVVTPDNVTYVMNYRPSLILRVDSVGASQQQVGRQGDGPGELRSVRAIGLAGRNLWLLDGTRGRLIEFDPTGRESRSFSVRPASGATLVRRSVRLEPINLLGDGSLVFQATPVSVGGTPNDPVLVLRGDTLAKRLDTLLVLGRPLSRTLVQAGGRPISVSSPIQYLSLFDVSGDGSSYVSVQQEPPSGNRKSQFVVTRYRLDGSVIFRKAIPYAPVPIPDSVLRVAQTSAGPPGSSAADALVELMRDVRFYPGATHCFLARDGRTWIRRGGPNMPSKQWLIVGAAGTSVDELRTPAGVQPLEADGKFAWAVSYDSDELPTIARYRIGR